MNEWYTLLSLHKSCTSPEAWIPKPTITIRCVCECVCEEGVETCATRIDHNDQRVMRINGLLNIAELSELSSTANFK